MTNNTQKSIAEDAGTKPFYMVIRLGSGGLQQHDSSPTVRYDSIVEAAEEAKRLAAKHPSHPRGFALVQAVAVYKAEVKINANYLNGNSAITMPFNTDANFPAYKNLAIPAGNEF
jgi:hypothetical protein